MSDEITTYEAADEALHHKRTGAPIHGKKIHNNTRLERREPSRNGPGGIAVRLHQTDVVTFHPAGQITLDTGGWFTVTTKDRMNRHLPAPFEIFSKNGSWHVALERINRTVHKDHAWQDIPVQHYCGDYACYDREEIWQSVPYFDGIILDPNGGYFTKKVVNASMVPDAKERDKRNEEMRRKIRNYVRRYSDERIRELLAKAQTEGTSGECWFCMIEHGQLNSEVAPKYAVAGGDHLESHLSEGYVMATLLWNAIKASGRRDPAYVMAYAPDLARHDLSRYLRKRLLEATMVNH